MVNSNRHLGHLGHLGHFGGIGMSLKWNVAAAHFM